MDRASSQGSVKWTEACLKEVSKGQRLVSRRCQRDRALSHGSVEWTEACLKEVSKGQSLVSGKCEVDRALSQGGVTWTISTLHGHCPAPDDAVSESRFKVTRL